MGTKKKTSSRHTKTIIDPGEDPVLGLFAGLRVVSGYVDAVDPKNSRSDTTVVKGKKPRVGGF